MQWPRVLPRSGRWCGYFGSEFVDAVGQRDMAWWVDGCWVAHVRFQDQGLDSRPAAVGETTLM
jgi:hypothetical protein